MFSSRDAVGRCVWKSKSVLLKLERFQCPTLRYRELCIALNISTSLKKLVLHTFNFFVTIWCLGFIQFCNASSSPGRPEFFAVAGEMGILPCNISTPLEDDAATLILWYREDLHNPIYTLDIRKAALKKARHFPSPEMEGKAYFDTSVHPPLLKIYPISKEDEGDYKCRVDLRRSRTFIHYIRLKIIVPPKVVINDESGQTLQGVIGPYDEGSSVSLFCDASEGEPTPSVTWWKGNNLIDDTYNSTSIEIERNALELVDLQRSDLLVEVSCQASNTNLSKPRITSVILDLNLRPLEVKVMPRRRALSVGWLAQLICEARGARPQAIITWWREGNEVKGSAETVMEDGNLTMSTFDFTPKSEDNGRTVTCKASHPTLKMEPIFDTVSLSVHFAPQLKLALGASNQHSAIKEGSDVYFECNIKANPQVTEVIWFMDDTVMSSNITKGVLIDNQSLILQNVGREHRGNYKCRAINTEGEGESDVVPLSVQYSPVCQQGVRTFNVVQGESLNITCDVEADPRPNIYQWSLNNTMQGSVDLKRRHPKTYDTLHYVPRYLGDYGTIMCWGKNEAGVQRLPCIVQIVPEGEVTTDLGILAPSTDEEGSGGIGRNSNSSFIISPTVGVLVGVVLALLTMIVVVVIIMRVQDTPPTRRVYFEEEKYKYPSPIKKEPNETLVDGNEKSPDIIPLPNEIEVFATPIAVEMCSTSPRPPNQAAEVYYTIESQTCL